MDETSNCLMTGSPIHQHRKISLGFSNRMCERHKNSFYINKGINPWVCDKSSGYDLSKNFRRNNVMVHAVYTESRYQSTQYSNYIPV